jgi:hypothetical protein
MARARAAWAAHPAADQEHATTVSRPPGHDTTTDADLRANAADREAHPTAEPPSPELDWPELDPTDLAPPDSEWPEWPDPALPLFTPSQRPPSYVLVLAVSPWYKERYPDKAANLWDALQVGKERHLDPEPDLEAEP